MNNQNKLDELMQKKNQLNGNPEDSGFEPQVPADNAPKDDKPASPEMSMTELETQFKDLMKADSKERQTAGWATAASHIASMLDKYSAEPVGIKPITFQAQDAKAGMSNLIREAQLKRMSPDGIQPMSEYQKSMMASQEEDRKLKREEMALRERLAQIKGKSKPLEPSFREKEEIKAEVKEGVQTRKEDRKLKKDIKSALPALDEQEKNIDKAIELIEKAQKGMGPDTGPLDQYISGFTGEGQKLKQAMNKISLDSMVKMFSGMSKAIDSDAERAFFQSAQPGVDKYPDVNLEILKDMKKSVNSLRGKTRDAMSELEGSKPPTPAREVMRKQYSPSRNQTKITYSDGTTEILDGRQ